MITQTVQRVQHIRELTDEAFVLRFERGDFQFSPGQYLNIGLEHEIEMREYSIYSAPQDPFLEILIREVKGGYLSKRLRKLRQGDALRVEGPFGYFLIDEDMRRSRCVFVGSGTGIAPFHCFVAAYPDLEYTLLHGVRFASQAYEHTDYESRRYHLCVSQERGPHFHGRVTAFLGARQIDRNAFYFLCGNCDMIYEVHDMLRAADVPAEHIFAEVYF